MSVLTRHFLSGTAPPGIANAPPPGYLWNSVTFHLPVMDN